MSEDVKRALKLGGGAVVAAVVVGGGWMFWQDGQRREALTADLASWRAAVDAYTGCLVGEGPADTAHILLSQAAERTRDGRCYTENLAGLTFADEQAAGLQAAVTALARTEPSSSRMSELDADQTCKQLAAVHTALDALSSSIGGASVGGAPSCAAGLAAWPLLTQPPADPSLPGIRKGALRRVELRGDRLFASYRMARQGVLAWQVDGADWSVVPSEQPLEGVFWGGESPWGIIPDPEAPPGMIRYRATAWTGDSWELKTALPEGMLPLSAQGPGGDYAVSGSSWLVAASSLREQSVVLLTLTGEGAQVGAPVPLMALSGESPPTLRFTSDGSLQGMTLSETAGGWTFAASRIAAGSSTAAAAQVFLPVDVPDPLQSSTIAACGEASAHALAADRWLLRGQGDDWTLHHTFEQPLRRAVLACHGDKVAILGDLDGAREAVELHYTVCDADACREPAALGEQQADGRGVLFDGDGVRLLAAMLGHAVVFVDAEADGTVEPEHIFSSADTPEDALPVLAVDGRRFAIRSGG